MHFEFLRRLTEGYWMLSALVLLTSLSACRVGKFIDPSAGERFLSQNIIDISAEPPMKRRARNNLRDELDDLYRQRPNRRLFYGVPRHYFYYAAQDTAGRSRLARFVRTYLGNTWGEDPVLYDSILTLESAENMTYYLRNRGYFKASVACKTDRATSYPHKAKVTYHVSPGPLYTIDSVEFLSEDSTVAALLQETSASTLLKKGSPVDVKLYDQEVARLTRFLRNNGYAYFYPQYISPLQAVDSSDTRRTVSVQLEILLPPGKERHEQFTVGNIYVYPNYDPVEQSLGQPDTLIDGLFFASAGKDFWVRPKTLANSFYIRSGQLFSQEKLDNSERQLSSLGVFLPLVINYHRDTLAEGLLNFHVPLSAARKWEVGYDFDLNTTERRGIVGNQNLIGLNFSPTLRNRNFLRGAELMVGNLNFGIELALFNGSGSFVNALDFQLQNDLHIPRFVDYLRLWKGLDRSGILGDTFYERLRQRANTRLSAGFNSLTLLNNYQLQFFNTSFGYDIPVSLHHRVLLNHFGVDLVIPTIQPNSSFDSLLNKVPSLQNSFSKQFISGLLLRDISFIYSHAPQFSRSAWYFRGYFDLSGLEAMGANKLYELISGAPSRWNLFSVDFSHYAKLELDGRYILSLGKRQSFVTRLNLGAALPFHYSEQVPYVKQFYVGGPYSIRGWYARELGPGLFVDPITQAANNRPLFYQSGNYKIEFNLEYRFFLSRPLGLFNLHGALFLDGGNVWTHKPDPARPGSHFALQRQTDENGTVIQDAFFREIALASGFGTRWDFTYFVLRLDLGTPVRNNFPDPGRRLSYWKDLSRWNVRDIRYQLALGYPF
ncbi:MAG: hypothetical protein RLY31_989 [Bacteroidota bacterium]|jgi:hypothetical protein